MTFVLNIAKRAKEASRHFCQYAAAERNQALHLIGQKLSQRANDILAANAEDLARAEKAKLNPALIERLTLTPDRILAMSKVAHAIASQEEVVDIIVEEKRLPNGLWVRKQRIPLGVLAMIFESRPNVVIDCSCLAIKSGNAMILKGGKEARASNQLLTEIVQESTRGLLPDSLIQIIEGQEAVTELITLVDYVDLVIPRGGEGLVRAIYASSKVPVIAHFRGLCHIYVHPDAELERTEKICLNAKVQRPGVCNAMECLLLNQALPGDFIKSLLQSFINEGVEIRGCEKTRALSPQSKLAGEQDYATEYLDKILSVKIVDSLEAAVAHIKKYGTHHTEGICATDTKAIAQFQREVDASCIMVNTSTRLNDGGELGLGAELGISTSKLHAYGPMGAREMTTTRFLVQSEGKIRL
ncbi:MAG: glutamate-5-semialdehyde dehydrogenase [Bdellovibrionales bacterium GWA2_49_15]|nr:MAG: glutamate-5-semialdehyde dehydrogenase [Bdellovibrionales bacterium GWA2_49_15]HAZ12853.1 glutamate-5-semialdehyde dehydrogenase [Bdellovibrionales bacterium]